MWFGLRVAPRADRRTPSSTVPRKSTPKKEHGPKETGAGLEVSRLERGILIECPSELTYQLRSPSAEQSTSPQVVQ